jgi:hypothetical protein
LDRSGGGLQSIYDSAEEAEETDTRSRLRASNSALSLNEYAANAANHQSSSISMPPPTGKTGSLRRSRFKLLF